MKSPVDFGLFLFKRSLSFSQGSVVSAAVTVTSACQSPQGDGIHLSCVTEFTPIITERITSRFMSFVHSNLSVVTEWPNSSK